MEPVVTEALIVVLVVEVGTRVVVAEVFGSFDVVSDVLPGFLKAATELLIEELEVVTVVTVPARFCTLLVTRDVKVSVVVTVEVEVTVLVVVIVETETVETTVDTLVEAVTLNR